MTQITYSPGPVLIPKEPKRPTLLWCIVGILVFIIAINAPRILPVIMELIGM